MVHGAGIEAVASLCSESSENFPTRSFITFARNAMS
jgi:hypothetical protein